MVAKEDHHKYWLDYLRVIATIMVVVLHVCARPLHSYGSIADLHWYLALILRNLTAVSVPLFFMISGYLYLNRDAPPIGSFLMKRVAKIVVPLLCWSYFWLAYKSNFSITLFLTPEIGLTPFIQPAMYHLWFMYPLIGLYLIVPLFSSVPKQWTQSQVIYFFVLWLLFVGLADYLPKIGIPSFAITPLMIGKWAGYFIAGSLLVRIQVRSRWLLLISTFTLITMIIGSYILAEKHGIIKTMFYEVSTLHMMLLSCCVFLLAYRHRYKLTENRTIKQLSERSYFVYLIHPLFILEAEQRLFADHNNLPLLYIPAMIALVLAGSYSLAFIVKWFKLSRLAG